MSRVMVGVDVGTTSTKALLFDPSGVVLGRKHVEYPLYTPTTAVAEQDPDQIFQAVVDAVGGVLKENKVHPESVQFVAFSAAMHSLLAVDRAGYPLTRSITWADNRSAEAARWIQEAGDGHTLYQRTGTPIHAMSPLSKLVWMKRSMPDIWARAYRFISLKEYVFHRLFGQYVVDHSIASATGLFHLYQLDWDEEALALAGVEREQLSKLVPTTHVLTGCHPKWAQQLGILPTTPFVIGASDGVLSNLGVAAIDPGVVALTIGTSGAIRTVTDQPSTDPKGRTFCYVLTPDHWVLGGPVNNGGVVLRWIRDEWMKEEAAQAKAEGKDPYERLMEMAGRIPAGSDGLLFHPYLMGERAPLWNADARGSFFGLGMHHTKEHLLRAAMEGVLFNLYQVFLALCEHTGEPKRIHATGGFARSALWRQMLADMFGMEVRVPEQVESSCLGAVVLGMKATGMADSFHLVKEWIGTTHFIRPDPKCSRLYEELMPIFIRVSRKYEEEYQAIAAFQRRHAPTEKRD
ncbi:gluconokinase [Salinithrix halophila]|uniref:Gluconokinase n=1 Tax=Salinithrix halophila TaxID=1485204 RepID=A0ABV8JEM8_9BACL